MLILPSIDTRINPVVPSANGNDCNLARASKLVIAPYLSVVCYETRTSASGMTVAAS